MISDGHRHSKHMYYGSDEMNLKCLLRIWIVIAVIPLSVIVGCEGSDSKDHHEEKAVQNTMDAWINAVVTKDERVLESVVSQHDIARYGVLRDLAMYSDYEEIAEYPLMEQIQVLLLRALVDADELCRMSSVEVLGLAVREQFIATELRIGDELQDIVIDGDSAHGRLYLVGNQEPDRYQQYFVLEDDGWRIDLRSELERLNGGLDQFRKKQGLTREEAAFMLLELRLLRKVTPQDFKPPIQIGNTQEENTRC